MYIKELTQFLNLRAKKIWVDDANVYDQIGRKIEEKLNESTEKRKNQKQKGIRVNEKNGINKYITQKEVKNQNCRL